MCDLWFILQCPGMVYAQIGAGVGGACECIVVFTFGDNGDFKTRLFIKDEMNVHGLFGVSWDHTQFVQNY